MSDVPTEAVGVGTTGTGPVGTHTTTIGELTGAIRVKLRQPARMRNLELALLVLACGIDFAAIGLVQLGANGEIDWSLLTLGAVLTGLVLVFHIVLRIVATDADPLILPVVTVLNGLGIAEIYRIDVAEGTTDWSGNSIKQIVWTTIAMVLAIVVILLVRNHRTLQRYSFVAMFVGLALLLLPMLPFIGLRINGAQLWVGIGEARFQPGELAKIALAVFFAAYLVQARDTLSMTGRRILGIRLPPARTLGPILVVFAVSMLVLIFQRDLGTSLLYFGLFLVVLYVGTGRGSWVAIGLLLFAGGAFVAGTTLNYVGGRITNWLDAFNSNVYAAQGGSYQLVQGIFGLGAGGLTGTGLGQGRPDLVPLAESDYIVASLGEELGLIGLFAILALYLLFVSRGFRIGFAAQDDFGRLLGVGLSFVIALQIFIVIGGVTRVIPLTGLTTPFLAAGGSSLVANWIIAALLLRVSDTIRHQPRWVIETPREVLS